jgi:hypothetical protein
MDGGHVFLLLVIFLVVALSVTLIVYHFMQVNKLKEQKSEKNCPVIYREPNSDKTTCPTCPECPSCAVCLECPTCTTWLPCPTCEACPTCRPNKSCPVSEACPTCPPNKSCPVSEACPTCPPNKSCPTCQNYTIGISYVPKSKEVRVLLGKIQDLFNVVQQHSCSGIRKEVGDYNLKVLEMIKSNPTLTSSSCSYLMEVLNESINRAKHGMKLDYTDSRVVIAIAYVDEIIKYVFTISCSNDRVDTDKASKLVLSIFESICSE